VLAETLWREAAASRESMLATACQRVLGRLPDREEQSILARLHEEQRAWFRGHPDDAIAHLKVGAKPVDASLPAPEIAALAVVVNTLMNHDSFVVKR
jgi:hypothetical protein